jgi:phosphoribosylamine--glycine ligase
MPGAVLIVGSGGREHAIAWRLAGEPGVERVHVAPGNPGMADVADIHPDVSVDDVAGLVQLARANAVELVVIGPEAPLVMGLTDELAASGVTVFGPSAAAAMLEGSKAFCREVAGAAGLPLAEGVACDDASRALEAVRAFGPPVVVKADGLAAGKGVTVCGTVEEAAAAIRAAMIDGVFGAAGRRVVIERALEGREASVIALCDATHALALPAARDHKRIFDDDQGPNTGGMGAYSPAEDLSEAEVARIVETFHVPVLAELARRGTPFTGALYAGLMLTADGPRLLEFNVRFGDPETQAVLPLLDAPLGSLMAAAAHNRLADVANQLGIDSVLLPVRDGASAAVVLAAPGYPGPPDVGARIRGVPQARAAGALVFCGGVATSLDDGAAGDEGLRTAGGRVLSVVGEGPDIAAAASVAYAAADRITFTGRQLRRDIGRSARVAAGVPR